MFVERKFSKLLTCTWVQGLTNVTVWELDVGVCQAQFLVVSFTLTSC